MTMASLVMHTTPWNFWLTSSGPIWGELH